MALTEKIKSHGGSGRGQGRKLEEIKSAENLSMRCLFQDKKKWKAAADMQGISLSAWVIKTLNQNS